MIYHQNLHEIKCKGCDIIFKPKRRLQVYHNKICYLDKVIIGKTAWNKGLRNSAFHSYFAGLIDGEGSIYICKINKNGKIYGNAQVSTSLQESDNAVLFEGCKIWGGRISTLEPRDLGKKRITRWILASIKAKKFLLDILPYMRIKQRQAVLAIEYITMKTGINRIIDGSLSNKQLLVRKDIEFKIKSLNARII